VPAQPPRPADAWWAAWACVLAPDAVKDADTLVQLAEQVVASDPKNCDYLSALGAALYRAGQYGEAVKRLGEAAAARKENEGVRGAEGYDWFFLAMAHHRQGRGEEARRWLGRAVRAAPTPANPGADKTDPAPWNRRLTFRLLRSEAESVLGSKPGAADKR